MHCNKVILWHYGRHRREGEMRFEREGTFPIAQMTDLPVYQVLGHVTENGRRKHFRMNCDNVTYKAGSDFIGAQILPEGTVFTVEHRNVANCLLNPEN